MEKGNHPIDARHVMASFQWGDVFGQVILEDRRTDNDEPVYQGMFAYSVSINQMINKDDEFPKGAFRGLYHQSFSDFVDALRLLQFLEKQYRTEELYDGWKQEKRKELEKLFEEA